MTTKKKTWQRISIIGVGLIGGCLALALKKAGVVAEIVGFDQSSEALQEALRLQVIDRAASDPADAVQHADIVVLCTPITAMATVLKQALPQLEERTIITDVGGTKASVIAAIRQIFGYLPAHFVPGHPIAGTEKHGVAAAFPTLFNQRRVVLTPHIENEAAAVTEVRQMWEACGAIVEDMGIKHHDRVLAATSHLPHLLAYSTVDTLANQDERSEIFRFAAGGFRDFTRIATSDPSMWADICLNNSESLRQVLQDFRDKLEVIDQAIAQQDRDTLIEIFGRAKYARDNFYQDPL